MLLEAVQAPTEPPDVVTSQFASLDWFLFNLVFLWFGVIEHGQCILYSMVHDILYLQNIKIQLIKSALGRLIAIQPKTQKNREGKKKRFLAKQGVCHGTLTRKACQTRCMAGK